MDHCAHQALQVIRDRAPGIKPDIAMILGSGTGPVATAIEHPVIIPFSDLPGFHHTTVSGHSGNLYLGEIKGVTVACLQGRPHYYEGIAHSVFKTIIYALQLLGCKMLLSTNAAGSLRKDIKPGSLVLLKDHINLQFHNVLVGSNDDSFGPRFLALQEAYDKELREQLFTIAKRLNITLNEGVYIGVLGPAYETPAEIRAFRMWGADLVGMSTIPEVILAKHCGMQVAVISVITNLASDISDTEISHEDTIIQGERALEELVPLIVNFIEYQKAAH